ncbi:MAG: ribosome maturation factor RimP [Candidatus Omnitrophica bacterium]|nr:ribosome maturation factor RimP [Candidatus Omnitrophota bacterium]
MEKIIDQITQIVNKVVGETEAIVYDISYKKEGSQKVLRVLLDKQNGISMDDCATVNKKTGEILENEELIDEPYIIEVNSAGLDRPLNNRVHYEMAIGKDVEIKLFAPIEGRKTFIGKLLGLTDTYIIVEDDKGVSFKLEFEKISKAKLYFK